jgi:hypothetical protein
MLCLRQWLQKATPAPLVLSRLNKKLIGKSGRIASGNSAKRLRKRRPT